MNPAELKQCDQAWLSENSKIVQIQLLVIKLIVFSFQFGYREHLSSN